MATLTSPKRISQRQPAAAAIAGLCGIAITAGALLPWVTARGRRPASGIMHTSLAGLFHWTYQNSSPFGPSFAIAVVACGLLVLAGAVAGSRLLTGFFSALALAAGGLWIGLNAAHYSPISLPYSDLRPGAWLTLAGGIFALAAAAVLRRPDPKEPHSNSGIASASQGA